MKKIHAFFKHSAIAFSVALVPAHLQAACVYGDCSALGFTKDESLCEGDIIRCPFDTSKVFCKESSKAECSVANCAQCTDYSSTYCAVCTSGYHLEYGSCIKDAKMVNLEVCIQMPSCSNCDEYYKLMSLSLKQGSTTKSFSSESIQWGAKKCISSGVDANQDVEITFSSSVDTQTSGYVRQKLCMVSVPQTSTGSLQCQDKSFWGNQTITAKFTPNPNTFDNKVTINYEQHSVYDRECYNVVTGIDNRCQIKKNNY